MMGSSYQWALGCGMPECAAWWEANDAWGSGYQKATQSDSGQRNPYQPMANDPDGAYHGDDDAHPYKPMAKETCDTYQTHGDGVFPGCSSWMACASSYEAGGVGLLPPHSTGSSSCLVCTAYHVIAHGHEESYRAEGYSPRSNHSSPWISVGVPEQPMGASRLHRAHGCTCRLSYTCRPRRRYT